MKRFNKFNQLLKIILLLLFILLTNQAKSARIKDIAFVQGASTIQVIGYGLVTGLNNTGDNPQTFFTNQSLMNMLKRFGLTIPQNNSRVRNVSAVMVTANVPPFSKAGSKVDVVVSSIGDATSLQGGVLLLTPLSIQDGTIIGSAQGPLSVGGYDFSAYGSRISKNVATTGRIPNGLILEQNLSTNFVNANKIEIVLKEPDFTTATRIQTAISGLSNMKDAVATVDAGTVEVKIPSGSNNNQINQLIAQIEALQVISDPVAKVVINERTGTIVIGGNVELLPATIANSGLEITIQKQVLVPQPAPFTIRPPRPAESAEITAQEEKNAAEPLVAVPPNATVQDMANALNALKVKPRDLISIFQALKEVGSLQAEIVIQW